MSQKEVGVEQGARNSLGLNIFKNHHTASFGSSTTRTEDFNIVNEGRVTNKWAKSDEIIRGYGYWSGNSIINIAMMLESNISDNKAFERRVGIKEKDTDKSPCITWDSHTIDRIRETVSN